MPRDTPPTCTHRRSRASPTCRDCFSGRPAARPAYVADGTLYSSSRTTTSRADRGPCGCRRRPSSSGSAADLGPLLSIDWSEDGRRHHTVVDPRNGSVSHDDIPIDARRIPAYFQRAMTEQSHDGLIRLRLRDHVVSAYATSEGWPIVETDDSFQLLAGDLARHARDPGRTAPPDRAQHGADRARRPTPVSRRRQSTVGRTRRSGLGRPARRRGRARSSRTASGSGTSGSR